MRASNRGKYIKERVIPHVDAVYNRETSCSRVSLRVAIANFVPKMNAGIYTGNLSYRIIRANIRIDCTMFLLKNSPLNYALSR